MKNLTAVEASMDLHLARQDPASSSQDPLVLTNDHALNTFPKRLHRPGSHLLSKPVWDNRFIYDKPVVVEICIVLAVRDKLNTAEIVRTCI